MAVDHRILREDFPLGIEPGIRIEPDAPVAACIFIDVPMGIVVGIRPHNHRIADVGIGNRNPPPYIRVDRLPCRDVARCRRGIDNSRTGGAASLIGYDTCFIILIYPLGDRGGQFFSGNRLIPCRSCNRVNLFRLLCRLGGTVFLWPGLRRGLLRFRLFRRGGRCRLFLAARSFIRFCGDLTPLNAAASQHRSQTPTASGHSQQEHQQGRPVSQGAGDILVGGVPFDQIGTCGFDAYAEIIDSTQQFTKQIHTDPLFIRKLLEQKQYSTNIPVCGDKILKNRLMYSLPSRRGGISLLNSTL